MSEEGEYTDLGTAITQLDELFGVAMDPQEPYLRGKPKQGNCLAYRVDTIERLDLPKPSSAPKFNQQGWEHGDRSEMAGWLRSPP